MDTIEKFRRIYPDVEIITTHFTSPQSDDFDMIIDSDAELLASYEKTLFISEKIMLAMKADNLLSTVKTIDISALKNEPFVTMSEKSSMYQVTNSICRDYGFAPKIAMQSDDPFYVRKCVELGLGICFVPAFSWHGQFSDNVVLKSVEGYKRHTYIFTNTKKHITLCAKRFFDMLLSEARI